MAPTITPFLWFDHQAEEAATFYTSVFPNSRITRVVRYGAGAPRPADSVMTVGFELDGQPFTALNGGPQFTFSQAISFVVHCTTQAEVDRYWDALGAGGQPQQCGWLKDRFGLSWQIVPTALLDMLQSDDTARVRRVTEAMLRMVKLDATVLRQVWAQE